MDIQIKTAPFARGFGWLSEGLEFFTRNPLGWIAAVIVALVIMTVIGIIPLGGILVYLFYPVFAGGFMLGCQAHARGHQFEFQHCFSAFQSDYLKRLILFGVYYAIASLFILVLIAVVIILFLGGVEFLQQLQDIQATDIDDSQIELLMDILLVLCIASLLFLPLVMAAWFAPVLIVTSNVSAAESMLLSFKACLYNIPAFTLFGLVALVLGILAGIPFGLGYLILVPVLTGSVYVAYVDCFDLPETEATSALATETK